MKLKELTKFLTRDASLIAIECWYRGRDYYFQKFFDFSPPACAFVYRNGAFEYHYDKQSFEVELPLNLARWLEKNESKLQLLDEHLKDALNFFEKCKTDKNKSLEELLDDLYKVVDLFARGYSGILIMHHLPLFQNKFLKETGKGLFDEQLVKKVIGWRESEGNVFFNKGVNIIYFLLDEIAKNKGWNPDPLKQIALKELIRSVKENEPLPLEAIKRRQNNVYVYFDYKIIFEPEVDQKLNDMGYQLKEVVIPEGLREIKGTVANKGIARGSVKVVFNRQQINKVEEGDIIVAPMTSVWYMHALKKASGIVTDEGGITCHAAIVSRELNKPCIIGTNIATRVLKDGDLVEADADKGIVKIIKRA